MFGVFLLNLSESMFGYFYRWLFCLFLISDCSAAFAQIDTAFWFAAPEVSVNNNRFDEPLFLNITAIDKDANVKIAIPANSSVTPISTTIAAGTSVSIDISSWKSRIENEPYNTVLNKGLYITSTEYIQVYYDVASTYCNCNPELFTLKGTNALGTVFYIPSQTSVNNSPAYSPSPRFSFDIVATQNNTTVSITPSKDILGHLANTVFSVVLNRGQTFSSAARSVSASDHPAGSYVVSDKPIAITIKDDLLEGIQFDGAGADLTGDQIVPVNRLGNEYILVKGKLGTGANERDLACFTATRDNTKIYIDGILTYTLNAGKNATHEVRKANIYINSTEPIYVLHISGLGRELGSALLPPIQCTGSKLVGARRSASKVFSLYLNILCPKGAEGSFLVNGNPGVIKTGDFVNVSGTSSWVTARVLIDSNTIHPSQRMIVSNDKAAFHIGLFQGAFINGTAYGYISNYGRNILPEKQYIPCSTAMVLKARPIADSVRWNNLLQDTLINIDKAGIYWVDYYTSCGTIRDSFVVFSGKKSLSPQRLSICSDTLKIKNSLLADSLVWSTGSRDSHILVSNPGIYWADNYTGCEVIRDSFVVTAMAVIPSTKRVLLCADTLLLNASGTSDSVRWWNGSRNNSVLVNGTGIYWVKKYIQCQIVIDSFIVKHNNNIVTRKDTFCENFPLTPNRKDSDSRFIWNTGDTTEMIIPSVSTQIYWVDVIKPCRNERDSFIRVHIELPPDTVICGQVDLLLNSRLDNTLWNNTIVSRQFKVQEPGRYIASYSSKYCPYAADTMFVNLSEKSALVFIPDAFTPNGDEVNDFFPGNMENVSNYKLTIFNRWGEKLFEETLAAWSGTFKQAIVQEGVYVYLFEYEDCKGRRYYLKGSVTLIK